MTSGESRRVGPSQSHMKQKHLVANFRWPLENTSFEYTTDDITIIWLSLHKAHILCGTHIMLIEHNHVICPSHYNDYEYIMPTFRNL